MINVLYERATGMSDGVEVYHIVKRDADTDEVLACIRVYPERPAAWWNGRINRRERDKLNNDATQEATQ